MTKFFMVALMAYALRACSTWHEPHRRLRHALRGLHHGDPAGLVVGAVAILLAAYSFVPDFENISDGVSRGTPPRLCGPRLSG
ncbi:Bax inhibitor-1/YccA family protein [Kocuria rhizophila]|nr:Bax inhibitor-1/YccA family protein [Kocuria rhizophila]